MSWIFIPLSEENYFVEDHICYEDHRSFLSTCPPRLKCIDTIFFFCFNCLVKVRIVTQTNWGSKVWILWWPVFITKLNPYLSFWITKDTKENRSIKPILFLFNKSYLIYILLGSWLVLKICNWRVRWNKAYEQICITNHAFNCDCKFWNEWLNLLITDLVNFIINELTVLNYIDIFHL